MKEKYSQFIVVGGGIAGSIAAYVCSKLKKMLFGFAQKMKICKGQYKYLQTLLNS